MNSASFFALSLLCGASAFITDFTNRISNGNIASYSQFPYSVSLQLGSAATTTNIYRGHRCGGALITYQHVLTTAFCVLDVVNGTLVPINASAYRIYGGSESLLGDSDQNRIRAIANVTIHPDYVAPPASVNNIAIITLLQPFLNITVQPISLPAAEFAPEDFTLCQIASWGSWNASASASYSLSYVNKYVYKQTVCETLYSQKELLANIFPSMICAASYDIVSSGCNGDIGSALICNSTLTGVLMQTNGCSVSSFPEVYTRVSNYTTWVTTITGGSVTFRPDNTLFIVFAVLIVRFFSTE